MMRIFVRFDTHLDQMTQITITTANGGRKAVCAALAFKTNDSDRRRRHLLSSSKYNVNLGPNRRYWGKKL